MHFIHCLKAGHESVSNAKRRSVRKHKFQYWSIQPVALVCDIGQSMSRMRELALSLLMTGDLGVKSWAQYDMRNCSQWERISSCASVQWELVGRCQHRCLLWFAGMESDSWGSAPTKNREGWLLILALMPCFNNPGMNVSTVTVGCLALTTFPSSTGSPVDTRLYKSVRSFQPQCRTIPWKGKTLE